MPCSYYYGVQNELKYDNFYKNSNRLYQSWNRDRGNKGISCWNNTPKILGPTLKKDYPEIEKATRVNWDATTLLNVGEKKMNVTGTMVDPDFLTMFGFPLFKWKYKYGAGQPGRYRHHK